MLGNLSSLYRIIGEIEIDPIGCRLLFPMNRICHKMDTCDITGIEPVPRNRRNVLTRHESIRYIHLRAEECGYPSELLEIVHKKLETLQEEELDHLKRISEPAFRAWCKQISNEDKNNESENPSL